MSNRVPTEKSPLMYHMSQSYFRIGHPPLSATKQPRLQREVFLYVAVHLTKAVHRRHVHSKISSVGCTQESAVERFGEFAYFSETTGRLHFVIASCRGHDVHTGPPEKVV